MRKGPSWLRMTLTRSNKEAGSPGFLAFVVAIPKVKALQLQLLLLTHKLSQSCRLKICK